MARESRPCGRRGLPLKPDRVHTAHKGVVSGLRGGSSFQGSGIGSRRAASVATSASLAPSFVRSRAASTSAISIAPSATRSKAASTKRDTSEQKGGIGANEHAQDDEEASDDDEGDDHDDVTRYDGSTRTSKRRPPKLSRGSTTNRSTPTTTRTRSSPRRTQGNENGDHRKSDHHHDNEAEPMAELDRRTTTSSNSVTRRIPVNTSTKWSPRTRCTNETDLLALQTDAKCYELDANDDGQAEDIRRGMPRPQERKKKPEYCAAATIAAMAEKPTRGTYVWKCMACDMTYENKTLKAVRRRRAVHLNEAHTQEPGIVYTSAARRPLLTRIRSPRKDDRTVEFCPLCHRALIDDGDGFCNGRTTPAWTAHNKEYHPDAAMCEKFRHTEARKKVYKSTGIRSRNRFAARRILSIAMGDFEHILRPWRGSMPSDRGEQMFACARCRKIRAWSGMCRAVCERGGRGCASLKRKRQAEESPSKRAAMDRRIRFRSNEHLDQFPEFKGVNVDPIAEDGAEETNHNVTRPATTRATRSTTRTSNEAKSRRP